MPIGLYNETNGNWSYFPLKIGQQRSSMVKELSVIYISSNVNQCPISLNSLNAGVKSIKKGCGQFPKGDIRLRLVQSSSAINRQLLALFGNM